MIRRTVVGVLMLLLVAGSVLFATVHADPAAPLSLIPGPSHRANFPATGNDVGAQAGNVTELLISGVSVTQTWQGYYGNISGRLTLQNADNETFYDWAVFSSTGEVYASNTSNVNWANVQCVNFTGNGSQAINVTNLENMFGVSTSDVDGFNETFNQTFQGEFYIGSKKINGSDGCPKTNLYNASGSQTENFVEVLMTDNLTRSVMFVALTENNMPGFDQGEWDFQMIVADDGHGGNTALTTYYFFVEMV